MTLIAKRWRFKFVCLLLLGSMLLSLLLPSMAATADCEDGEPVAEASATCRFTHTTNASLGLNATIWVQQLVNDSWWWGEYGNLTWAFEPNLAFWSYLWANLARITADLTSAVFLKEILWSLPLKDWEKPNSSAPLGQLRDFNNGTYKHWGTFTQYPTETMISTRDFAVDNFTIIIREAPLFPSESWFAEVYWDWTGGLSGAQWTALADQLAAQLNVTWYMEACVFNKEYLHCDDTGISWPFDAVFLGLLVLLGVGHKRKRRDVQESRS